MRNECGDEDSIGDGTRDHSCYRLAKNLSTLCPYSKTLYADEFTGEGLINLVEEISRQPRIQAVAWLRLATFRQIYCVD
jgi:hypothetical protein